VDIWRRTLAWSALISEMFFFGAVGLGNVTPSAYDATNAFLGSVTATNFGNGLFEVNSPGATTEDPFFGVTNSTGVSKIILNISNNKDWRRITCNTVISLNSLSLRLR